MSHFANIVRQKGGKPRLKLIDHERRLAEASLTSRAALLLALWYDGRIADLGDEAKVSKAASELRIALAASTKTYGPNAAVAALLRVFASNTIPPITKCGFGLLLQDHAGVAPGYAPIAPREIDLRFAATLCSRAFVVGRHNAQLIGFAKAIREPTEDIDVLVRKHGIRDRSLIELLHFSRDRATTLPYSTDLGKICREVAARLLDVHVERLHANLDPADENLDRLIAVVFVLQLVRRPQQAPSILFACRCSSDPRLLELARLYDEGFRGDAAAPVLRPN